MTDNTLSTVEAAEALGGTRQWVYKLIKRGELEAERIGRDWRVTRESVEKYLQEHGRNEQ